MKLSTNLLLACAIVFLFHASSSAQNVFPNPGNVGIGTSTPTTQLQVVSNNLQAISGTANNTGTGFFGGYSLNVNQNAANTSGTGVEALSSFIFTGHPSGSNIVVTTPGLFCTLHQTAGTMTEARGVMGQILQGQTAGNIDHSMCFYANTGIVNGGTSTGTIGTGYGFYMGSFSSNYINKYGFYISDGTADNYLGGTLSIGTTSTDGYKLAVNGSAIFTQAVVKLFANWPDYVFRTSYRLPSLDSLKAYISLNSHLPEIPSEEEIKDKGQDLGATQTLLLKKIEELTLYVIRQNDQLAAQQTEIDQLKQQLLGKHSGKGK
ncbi:MAG TPA: hypothetical protein VNU70_00645 [Puia sp.]|jgi:hypothetical protein|nr:hypothetical protein [Puia sp.]